MKACPTCAATYANNVVFCPRDGAALRSTAGLELGSVIGKKYEIIREIGRGGMGVVYRARHLIWNEEKAIKVLAADGADAQQGLKGLLAEALVMRQLQHPNIVRVEDADYTEDGQLFVVMEYLDGQSLRQRLTSMWTLAPEVALNIAAQTCSALSAAHQKGIIHRDIKPQNLLLVHDAHGNELVKVIDFGIAKVREDAGLGFTGMMSGTTGFFVGTPEYASPEQAQGMRGSDLDGRTDVYSLGLVLYEMLTGQLPFTGNGPVGALVQRLQVPPMPLDRARPDLTFSPDVAGLVMKALERDRDNRWRSTEKMERAIQAVLDSRRTEREQAEAAKLATEQGWRKDAEMTRPTAGGRQAREEERESAQASSSAAEQAERERHQHEETVRLATEREQVQAIRERLARDVERKKQDQASHTLRKDYGDATRFSDGRKHRQRSYGIAGFVLALAAAGYFMARYVAEKSTLQVGRQPAPVQAPKGESFSPTTPLSETARGRAAISMPTSHNVPESFTTLSEPRPLTNGTASHLSDGRTTLTGIQFQVVQNGGSSRRYLLIHGNEYTARAALRSYVQTHSGTALLVAGTDRFVRWGNATVDPNRLFSREGAERNLRHLNGSRIADVLPQILDQLDAQRQELVQAITPQPGGLIVAPHNTSQHSIHDEIPLSNSYEMRDPGDPYSFYLCTDPNDYRLLAASGFNVVLQNQPRGDDDGSLSRLAARLGIRYVNIETPLGQFVKQTKMIAWADANLP